MKLGTRKTNPRTPLNDRSRALLAGAVASGRIQRPDECQECGARPGLRSNGRPGIEAHHTDYTKPYDVRWLCLLCHSAAHRGPRPSDISPRSADVFRHAPIVAHPSPPVESSR